MPPTCSPITLPWQLRKRGGRPRRACTHELKFDTEGRCIGCRNERLRKKYRTDPDTRAWKKVSAQKTRKNNPKSTLLHSAQARARKGGYPCTITRDDIVIPEFCPLLGIKLETGRGSGGVLPSSPSLDKIIPSMGYVPGNVWVVSHRANSLKRDSVLEEIELLARNWRACTA